MIWQRPKPVTKQNQYKMDKTYMDSIIGKNLYSFPFCKKGATISPKIWNPLYKQMHKYIIRTIL